VEIILSDQIQNKIHSIRGIDVMLDSDIAELYGVETKRINEAVARNPDKFPDDFMFKLDNDEWQSLRSQFATLDDSGRGKYSKYTPTAFTEQGVYMLSTVLKSGKATQTTITIMRAFTKMRHYLLEHADLASQIRELRAEVAKSKEWTKERLSAVADSIIMLEDSLSSLDEMVESVGAAKEIESIGFLRGKQIKSIKT
jgi:phage regulator Rha-like protein